MKWGSVLLWGWLCVSMPVSGTAAELAAGFDALYDTDDVIPADTHGAVGRTHIFTTLNTQVRVQKRSGEHVHTMSLSSFWKDLGTVSPFDPKSAYDPVAGRWIFVAASNRGATNSSLLLAVSQGEDPSARWHLHRIEGGGGATTFVDYPSLGFNKKWVVVQYLMKRNIDNTFASSHVYVFDKADLYNGGSGKYRLFTNSVFDVVQAPAHVLDDSEDLYLAGTTTLGTNDNNSISLFKITGPVGNEMFQHVKTFGGLDPWTSKAPNNGNFAPQRDSEQKLHLQDGWIYQAIQKSGTVWACHHVFLPNRNPTRSAIQWFELKESGVVASGKIEDSSGGYFYAYPSMAMNARGDLLISYAAFAKHIYPSAYYSLRFHSTTSGAFQAPALLKAGLGVYYKTKGTGKNRWGDYSATVVDPMDNSSFWSVHQYASNPVGDPAVDGSGRWSTWWTKIIPGEAPTLALLEPSLKNGRLSFSFQSEANKEYQLQRRSELNTGVWQTIQTIRGTGGRMPIEVESNTFRQAFFRVAAL